MRKLIKSLIVIGLLGITLMLSVNFYVVNSSKNKILKEIDTDKLNNIDCILILGAGIRGNSPSPMLEDRLIKSIDSLTKSIPIFYIQI